MLFFYIFFFRANRFDVIYRHDLRDVNTPKRMKSWRKSYLRFISAFCPQPEEVSVLKLASLLQCRVFRLSYVRS